MAIFEERLEELTIDELRDLLSDIALYLLWAIISLLWAYFQLLDLNFTVFYIFVACLATGFTIGFFTLY